MEIVKSTHLEEQYPNLKFIPQTIGWKILSICKIDGKRCLNPNDSEEDYSLDQTNADRIRIIRVFTAYADDCKLCKRNKTD